jgi:hypothetical protein
MCRYYGVLRGINSSIRTRTAPRRAPAIDYLTLLVLRVNEKHSVGTIISRGWGRAVSSMIALVYRCYSAAMIERLLHTNLELGINRKCDQTLTTG